MPSHALTPKALATRPDRTALTDCAFRMLAVLGALADDAGFVAAGEIQGVVLAMNRRNVTVELTAAWEELARSGHYEQGTDGALWLGPGYLRDRRALPLNPVNSWHAKIRRTLAERGRCFPRAARLACGETVEDMAGKGRAAVVKRVAAPPAPSEWATNGSNGTSANNAPTAPLPTPPAPNPAVKGSKRPHKARKPAKPPKPKPEYPDALPLARELLDAVQAASGRTLISTPAGSAAAIRTLLKRGVTARVVRDTIAWLVGPNRARETPLVVLSGAALLAKWDRAQNGMAKVRQGQVYGPAEIERRARLLAPTIANIRDDPNLNENGRAQSMREAQTKYVKDGKEEVWARAVELVKNGGVRANAGSDASASSPIASTGLVGNLNGGE